MNYSSINKFDDKNGDGARLVLFVSGCPHKCFNCFNKSTWGYLSGDPFSKEIEQDFFDYFEENKEFLSGISLLGGEPLAPRNLSKTSEIMRKFKDTYSHLGKDIWVWSGYTLEELKQNPDQCSVLPLIDTLIDGKYVDELRDPELKHRGSSNQRILKNGIDF
ncbi:anaerobic ribonucleoside-triphosphate reductase activating protein [Photobacterium damselae]|uniref:anaerobic ribonucleoside-triphosphate reductase activating protein n=1 Tax=Photobacterium damselae TaxID=38293 RepID=UPI001EEF477E|nr:anaerobic ribonucleoside-triphosphate reductase activating protein [Photobacterium damselae]UKA04526.1 anaerobic ribonucleoside-triphosphate reductase activating protein [Photobacterium damselae subsp. damselae]